MITGGFGAWQLERKHMTDKYGIDSVLIGGRPEKINEVFRNAVNGQQIPQIIKKKKSEIICRTGIIQRCQPVNMQQSMVQ